MNRILVIAQGIQANKLSDDVRNTRIYDCLKEISSILDKFGNRLSVLEAALAALGVTTTTTTNNTIEILVNGQTIGSSNTLNIEGDEEISVSGNDDGTQINVNIELISLQRRYRKLLNAWVTTGFDIPPGLEEDFIRAQEEV